MSATPLALRFFSVLVASKEDLPLADKVTASIVKDRAGLAEEARRLVQCKSALTRGLVVTFVSQKPAILSRLAKDGAAKFRSALVKIGGVQPSDELDLAAFSHVVEVKSEADIESVLPKLLDEVFGKNAPALNPIVIDRNKIVFTKAAADVTSDEVKAALGAFGKVDRIHQIRKNFHRIIFDEKENAQKAVEKKEVAVGSTTVEVSDKSFKFEKKAAPKKGDNAAAAKGEAASNGKAEASPRFYMKIDDFPESLDSKAVKELYSKFGAVDVVNINRAKKHCIMRLPSAEKVAEIGKEKVVAPGDVELVAKPYSPKGAGRPKKEKSTEAKGNKENKEAKEAKESTEAKEGKPANGNRRTKRGNNTRKPRQVTHQVYINGVDSSKVTPEQLEGVFKGFKGFVRLWKSKDNQKFSAHYDNTESVAEVLKSKEIVCNGVTLQVTDQRPPRPEGEENPRAAKRAFITKPPEGVTEEQVKAALQALDKDVQTVVGKRSGDILLTFSTPELKASSVDKEITVGGHTLKITA